MDINAPPKSLEKLSRNIKFERDRRGISQRKLAEELGLKGSSTVTHWEKGNNYPTLEIFVQLCVFFGKRPDEMLGIDLTGTSPPKGGEDTEDTTSMAMMAKEGGHKQPAAANREEPPPKAEKGELQAMRRQVLEVLNKIEEMESAQ